MNKTANKIIKGVEYTVIGKGVKANKRIESLVEYIANEFNVKGKRLGLNNFVKQFGKFNNEKNTLQSSSVVSVKDIQIASRLVASLNVESGLEIIPVVISLNGVVTIKTKNAKDFEIYYPSIKEVEKKEVDPTEFIIKYLNKHSEEVDFEAISTAIEELKNQY